MKQAVLFCWGSRTALGSAGEMWLIQRQEQEEGVRSQACPLGWGWAAGAAGSSQGGDTGEMGNYTVSSQLVPSLFVELQCWNKEGYHSF